MVRCDTPEGAAVRSQQHQLWLGMQAAYRKYRKASALVHGLADDLSGDAPSLDGAIELQTATHDQRTAFEGYIEARLQFLEFSCDRNHHEAAPGRLKTNRFVCAVGVITVGLTALNILCLSWARPQAVDLNTIRPAVNQIMNESSQSPQVLSAGITPDLAVPQAASAVPSRTPGTPKRSRRPSAIARRPNTQLSGRYAYREFTVAVSPQFTPVGLIRISARSVDRRARNVNLCVASGTATFCKTAVNPDEWLEIRLGDRRSGVELLVTRIGSRRVQGYFRTAGNWPPLKVNSLQAH